MNNNFILSLSLTLITAFSVQNILAQGGPPQGVGNGGGMPGGPTNNFWNLDGNELQNGQFLGSTNNVPLIFQTNGIERLRILSNGNIGIATTAPEYPLDVDGNIRVNGNGLFNTLTSNGQATFGELSVNGNGLFNTITSNGQATFGELNVNGNATVNGALSIESLSVTQQSIFNSLTVQNQLKVGNSLYVNDLGSHDEVAVSSKKLTIATSDNNGFGDYNEEIFVGIGTKDPERELHIKGWTCADCPLDPIGDTPPSVSTVFVRLEDELYNQGTTTPIGSRYWDMGVSGHQGNFFLSTENMGVNIFNISDEGKITAYDMRLRDNKGSGETFFNTNHIDDLSFIELKKDWSFLSFSDSDQSNEHPNGVWAIEYEPIAEGLNFWKPFPNETGHGNYFLFLANDGNIGMGTDCTPYKLNVDGIIGAREVIVEIDDWCDYVFEEEYPLMALSEVKTFINDNGHLPKISPAIEIETEGLNLGDIQKLQMEKIEELTLYTIEQQEQLDEQKELLEKQTEVINQQKSLLEEQQKALEELKLKTSK